MKNIYIFLFILFLLTSCGNKDSFEKIYEPDLRIEIPNSDDFIVIKEWSLLLAGGSDIYFENKNGEQTLIGETSGTDDGYKPFKNGKYEITWGDNNVTLSYDFGSGDIWKTETFEY